MWQSWQRRPRKIGLRVGTLLLGLLWSPTFIQPTRSIWPFPPKRYSGNALLEAGRMGVDVDGRVVAFGDFNGDQFLDLLTIAPDQQTFTFYLWDHEEYTFSKSTVFKHPRRVYNVVPGDFTQDGRLDFLVMSQGAASSQISLDVYVALPDGGFDMQPHTVSASGPPQPIPVDITGDLKIDLFGVQPLALSQFQVWKNVWNISQPTAAMFEITEPMFDGAQCTLSNPHSNAAIDLNGDCLADLFLVCDDGKSGDKYFQIWVNNKASGYSFAQRGRLPRGVQSITFGDINRDGTIDILFTTCDSVSQSTGIGTNCMINIAYNRQLPLCASATAPSVRNGKRICRPPTDLCTPDPDFRFNLHDGDGNEDFVKIPITSIFPPPKESPRPLSLLVLDTTHNPPLPLPIKLGDVNQDGFPDLLAILASGSSAHPDKTPYIAYSIPCARGAAGCDENGRGKRGFKMLKRGGDVLGTIKDARGAAFIDLDEDGTLDIMVQRTGEQGHGNVLFVQNNFYFDAFFLKAIVLNGACGSSLCTSPNGSHKYHPFGVSYSGASYKYTVLDTSGRRSAAQVGQLPQTSYQTLLTPYSYFGLGRTNNYIENLFVGSTKHTGEHYINMEGVIPNSKVVIIPPINGHDEGEASWKRELYLRPGEWIPWVTVVVVVSMAVLGIIVFVLHLNEKREDELERRRTSHHINFDAL